MVFENIHSLIDMVQHAFLRNTNLDWIEHLAVRTFQFTLSMLTRNNTS